MIRDSCLALLMLSSGTCREGTFSQDDEDEDWDDRDEDEEDEEMGEAHMSQPLHASVGMLSDASEMGGDHMRGQTDTSMVLPQKIMMFNLFQKRHEFLPSNISQSFPDL